MCVGYSNHHPRHIRGTLTRAANLMFNLILEAMLQGIDLNCEVKSGVIGSNNSAYIAFKYNGANKCAFNFTGSVPNEGETLQEFLDRTSSDISLEEWTKTNENGETESHRNFTVRLSFE
jgi:hypothetical protein